MEGKAYTYESCDKASSTEEIPKYHLSCFIYYLRVQVENRDKEEGEKEGE